MSAPMTTRTDHMVIRTPEGITFSLMLAGPTTRFMAWAIDIACLAVLTIASSQLASLFGVFDFTAEIAMALLGSWMFVMPIAYGILMEWLWQGQTIGKRVLGLRVMDEQGLKLQFSQIALRNLLRIVDRMPLFYLVGGAACILSRRGQRLGDFAANTIVVRTPKLEQPDLTHLMSDKFNSLREHAHLAALLRQRVTPEEARLALSALVRREGLEPEARVALFAELAEHFRGKVPFPEEAVIAMPDEQYVRNVVDLVFRPQSDLAASGGPSNAKEQQSVSMAKP